MLASQRRLQKDFPHIQSIRCAAHVISLFIEDLCTDGTVSQLIDDFLSLVTLFKQSKEKQAAFNRMKSKLETSTPEQSLLGRHERHEETK